MKLDIKSIIILVLLGFSLIFFFRWYFSDIDNYKNEVNKLREANKILKSQRDSIDQRIINLQTEYDKLQVVQLKISSKILETEKEISKAREKATLSRHELEKVRKELQETRNKLTELEKNPSNRTGDDLLNSLKNKTKK